MRTDLVAGVNFAVGRRGAGCMSEGLAPTDLLPTIEEFGSGEEVRGTTVRPFRGLNLKDFFAASGCCKSSDRLSPSDSGTSTCLDKPWAAWIDSNFGIRERRGVVPLAAKSRSDSLFCPCVPRSKWDGTGAIGVVDGRDENWAGPLEAGLSDGDNGSSPSSSSSPENASSFSSASLSGAIDPGGIIVDMENG